MLTLGSLPGQVLAQSKIVERPVIVLVHGAFMDASAWHDTQVALEDKGLRVITVNLPGRSANPAEPSEMSLPIYRDAVLAAIAAEPRPVILVGHSFGGITISNVAEAAPEKIAALVYVAAYLPREGQSLQMLAGADRDSRTAASFVVDPKRQVAGIAPPDRAGLFCNDCTPTQARSATSVMLDEPLTPLGEPPRLGPRFEAIPKYYVRTTGDLVISPAQQDRMIAATPDVQVESMNAGHLPMISQAAALAGTLDRLARNFSSTPKE